MKKEGNSFLDAVIVPLLLLLFMWIVFYIDNKYQLHLYQFSLLPRKLNHLPGIFIAPFIHDNLSHIFSNSLPFLLLSSMLYFYYREIATKILCLSLIGSGLFVWLFANIDESKLAFHIGASGLVYCLASFLVVSGFIRKHKLLFGASLLIVFLYGTLIWGIFPVEFQKAILFYQGPDNVSWESHLGGFTTGFLLAFAFKNVGLKQTTYAWEQQDEDEDEADEENPYWLVEEDIKEEEENSNFQKESNDQLKFNYNFLPNNQDGKKI